MKKLVGLYIHVPFCVTKCNYCGFYSVEYTKNDRITADSYKSAVIRNVRHYIENEQIQIDSVFFGGGTPSVMYGEVAETVNYLRKSGTLTSDAEITAEVNPDDVNAEMLNVLFRAGINRLSVGVQSLYDSVLQSLGRRHNSETAIGAVELAYECGFRNISADIMIGVPGQTSENLLGTVSALTDLRGVEHISAYIYESKSPCFGDEIIADFYLETVALLESLRFNQYEISNFASETDRRCRHNLKYWNCEEYVGIGSSAHSFMGNKRFAVPKSIESFTNRSLQETYITEEEPNSFTERVMLKIRLTDGISSDGFSKQEWKLLTERAKQIPSEYVRINKSPRNSISLTPKGFLISNNIITHLTVV
jgi:oxygen-independent coproporphyrinogen-3 oxidase